MVRDPLSRVVHHLHQLAAPPGSAGIPPQTVAVAGINLTALVLLAYVAMVIAREQRRARDAAIRLSTIDPLTGLFNRTFFFAAVEREIARSARSGRGFCLLMMDLDELKQINDRHGHFFGDRVLRGVGEVIRSGGRRIDTAAGLAADLVEERQDALDLHDTSPPAPITFHSYLIYEALQDRCSMLA